MLGISERLLANEIESKEAYHGPKQVKKSESRWQEQTPPVDNNIESKDNMVGSLSNFSHIRVIT